MVNDGFDYVDANGDGHVTEKEINKALKKHGGKKGIKDVRRKYIQTKMPELTDEQIKDIENFLEAAFADGVFTWEEAVEGVNQWEAKYGPLPKGAKKALKEVFEAADTDNSGGITVEEAEAFLEKHA